MSLRNAYKADAAATAAKLAEIALARQTVAAEIQKAEELVAKKASTNLLSAITQQKLTDLDKEINDLEIETTNLITGTPTALEIQAAVDAANAKRLDLDKLKATLDASGSVIDQVDDKKLELDACNIKMGKIVAKLTTEVADLEVTLVNDKNGIKTLKTKERDDAKLAKTTAESQLTGANTLKTDCEAKFNDLNKFNTDVTNELGVLTTAAKTCTDGVADFILNNPGLASLFAIGGGAPATLPTLTADEVIKVVTGMFYSQKHKSLKVDAENLKSTIEGLKTSGTAVTTELDALKTKLAQTSGLTGDAGENCAALANPTSVAYCKQPSPANLAKADKVLIFLNKFIEEQTDATTGAKFFYPVAHAKAEYCDAVNVFTANNTNGATAAQIQQQVDAFCKDITNAAFATTAADLCALAATTDSSFTTHFDYVC